MPSHAHIFHQYLNPWFIEGGTFHGEGIEAALTAGFTKIKSIEIHEPYVLENRERFKDNPNIEIIHGSTETQLWNTIKNINEPITFWNDSHYSGLDTPRSDQNCPLIDELRIIAQHPIKTHTIMIDDIRCCGTPYFDSKYGIITQNILIEELLKINPNYSIYLHDSWEPNDIMVAKVEI